MRTFVRPSVPLSAKAVFAAIVGVATLLVGSATPAVAAPGTYAQWTMAGAGGAYTGTMTIPLPNFPAATFTSDARADSEVETGASSWLGAGTPFGAVYGSSQAQPYLRLRPAADSPTTPSTTTYTFATPTPAGNWGFALGDIDADEITVSATDANGNPVPVADLGFAGTFNFCETSPQPSTCSGVTSFDVPTWEPLTTSGTLHGHDEALDTTGATGWFQPKVPLSTLTFVFRQASGFPIYQTWFTSLPQQPPPPATPALETPATPATPVAPASDVVTPAAPPAEQAPATPTASARARGRRTLPATGSSVGLQAVLGLGLVAMGAASVRLASRLRRAG